MRTIYTLCAFLLCCGAGKAQQKQQKQQPDNQKADKAFAAFRYKEAALLYEKSYKANSGQPQVAARLADSYRQLHNYIEMEYWSGQALRLDSANSLLYLRYAQALAANAKYEEAATWYNHYYQLTCSPEDDKNFATAYRHIDSFSVNAGRWQIAFASINSGSADYSPAFYGNGLVFVSNRKQGTLLKRLSAWDETPFTRLYLVKDRSLISSMDPNAGKSKEKPHADITPATSNDSKTLANYTVNGEAVDRLIQASTAITQVLEFPASITSAYYSGPASFTQKGDWAIVTQTTPWASYGDKAYNLQLYTMRNSRGAWRNEGSFEHNDKDYTSMHPALSADGNILYFASDRPGGHGGMDIYYCVRSGNRWSAPANMGAAVNTSGNEVFPFTDSTGTLYFASDGWVGLGGLDVFAIKLKGHVPDGKAVNLGTPVNSSRDDFGFIINSEGEKGYFSSNRDGDDNIYQFRYSPAGAVQASR